MADVANWKLAGNGAYGKQVERNVNMDQSLKTISVKANGLITTVYPSIQLDGEIRWTGYACLEAMPGVWIVNGGQNHATAKEAYFALMEKCRELADQFESAVKSLAEAMRETAKAET